MSQRSFFKPSFGNILFEAIRITQLLLTNDLLFLRLTGKRIIHKNLPASGRTRRFLCDEIYAIGAQLIKVYMKNMIKNNFTGPYSFLPNAPLFEVVFELHWKLQGDAGTPPPFWTDPGYSVLASNFSSVAGKYGFKVNQKISQDPFLPAHSIGMRFHRAEDEQFPLWQIGPGIFASNESAAYTWPHFKKLAIDGVKAVLSSYPPIKGFDFKLIHMELRYMDSFDSFISHQDPLKFINENSSLRIDLPSFFKKKPIEKSPNANLLFEFPISNLKDSNFIVRIANATVKGKKSILLESKVIAKADPISFGKTLPSRLQFISNWLEGAHSLTSPFFKEFLDSSLLKKFERPSDAST